MDSLFLTKASEISCVQTGREMSFSATFLEDRNQHCDVQRKAKVLCLTALHLLVHLSGVFCLSSLSPRSCSPSKLQPKCHLFRAASI